MQTLTRYCEFLELEKPVDLRIIQRFNKSADAYYEPIYNLKGKLKRHKITVYMVGACRDFDTLLAHELVHAWQEEKGFTKRAHGRHFRCMAQKIGAEFNLKDLYLAGIDVD